MSQQIVDILLKIDARTEALVKAQKGVQQLSASFKSIAGAATAFTGINLSIQGLIAFTKQAVIGTLQWAHRVQDLADQLGTTTDAIQVMDYAGRRMGTDIDGMTRVLLQFNARLAEAAGKGGEALKQFDALGLSVDQLTKMTAEERLGALGRALARSRDNAQAMNAAIKLTGVESQKLLNVIEQFGSRAYSQWESETRSVGQLVDKELLARAAEFDQWMQDTEVRSKSWMLTVVTNMRSAVRSITDRTGFTDDWIKSLAPPPGKAKPSGESGITNAELDAGKWLDANAEKYQAQIALAKEAAMVDEERYRAASERISALNGEYAAAMQAAAGENARAKLTLEHELALTKLEQERFQLGQRILEDQARAEQERLRTVQQLTSEIGNAIINGESLGDVIANTFKRIAAEAITAALMMALFGEKLSALQNGSYGTGGSLVGSLIGAFSGGYAGGGYTGSGGKHQPAGIVHRGEYVMPADVVGRYGAAYFDRALSSLRHAPGYADGGFVGRSGAAPLMPAGDVINVNYTFEAGVSPAQLAALLPEMEERTIAGVSRALKDRRIRGG